MSPTLRLLTIAAALGCGLVAGVFFAFSTFVMPALARLPPAQGVAAMQAINLEAINRWLMGALFGTAAACLALAVRAVLGWGEPGAGLRLAGGLAYLLGAILVTAACNVPRNEALAPLPPGSEEAARRWAAYLRGWTGWNHVRTLASLAAAAAFTASLGRG